MGGSLKYQNSMSHKTSSKLLANFWKFAKRKKKQATCYYCKKLIRHVTQTISTKIKELHHQTTTVLIDLKCVLSIRTVSIVCESLPAVVAFLSVNVVYRHKTTWRRLRTIKTKQSGFHGSNFSSVHRGQHQKCLFCTQKNPKTVKIERGLQYLELLLMFASTNITLCISSSSRTKSWRLRAARKEMLFGVGKLQKGAWTIQQLMAEGEKKPWNKQIKAGNVNKSAQIWAEMFEKEREKSLSRC